MKNRIFNISPTSLVILLAMVFGFSSCKNKKKLTEMSDPVEVREEIAQEEMGEEPKVIQGEIVSVVTKEQKLNNYFGAIATATTPAAANASINEALTMFSNGNAPVLIVIYKDGAKPDYDEPTTIEKYLNYLKDTKNNKAKVEEVVYDTNGKIKELVLKK
jgi:CMP-N-acetylneuraminic acid synthetase